MLTKIYVSNFQSNQNFNHSLLTIPICLSLHDISTVIIFPHFLFVLKCNIQNEMTVFFFRIFPIKYPFLGSNAYVCCCIKGTLLEILHSFTIQVPQIYFESSKSHALSLNITIFITKYLGELYSHYGISYYFTIFIAIIFLY